MGDDNCCVVLLLAFNLEEITGIVDSLRQGMWFRSGRKISVTDWVDGMGVGMQVAEAVRVLLPEFNEIDGMVAVNINRVLDAYAHARIGSHVRTSLPFSAEPWKLHKFCASICVYACAWVCICKRNLVSKKGGVELRGSWQGVEG